MKSLLSTLLPLLLLLAGCSRPPAALEPTAPPGPAVQVEYRSAGGAWLPLPAGASLPRGPLSLRFRLIGEPDMAQVRERIAAAIAAPVEQKGSDLLELTVANPPPKIWFNFSEVPAAGGKVIAQSYTGVYAGPAPRLVALDPATGAESALGEVPADIQEAELSPDSKWAVLSVMDPTAAFRHVIHVLNTETGKTVRLEPAGVIWGLKAAWAEGRVTVPVGSLVSAYDLQTGKGDVRSSRAQYWGDVSPDQRYLFGIAGGEGTGPVRPVTLVFHDTLTGKEQVLTDAVGMPRPFHAPYGIHHGWTRDGLLVTDVLEADETRTVKQQQTVKVDPATGKMTPTAEAIGPAGKGDWVGDGTGVWQYNHDRNRGWGPVVVKQGEREAAWGQGLIVGWRHDGQLLVVRWENSKARRIFEGGK